ncbi:LysR family transcriptional regulator [Piscinibacter koreensis]|uniref:LysR family transcriptional regulator n=1 Tax=Piscinibacter koreensis TaxID=2742824 RepID=A0A7Y6NPP3_9BURK|nr:LysR family transcriptional regulator [Schlegelella koreensis]NUZ06929.1 LysR family transcriptional regulator [Schlegelella koreensis]
MRLDDLRYFVAVAEEAHVGRAAQRLGVSQPALTKGVQRLEASLGLVLFERSARGMTLTSVGQVFFDRARHLCLGLDEAVQEASDLHLGAIGTIRIGVSPLFADSLVAETFAQLLRQRPGAKARLAISLNDTLLASLRLGDLDLSINALDDAPPDGLAQEALFDDELCIALREGHPLLARPQLRMSDLAEARWALPGVDVLARRRIEARLAEEGAPPPNVVLQLDSSVTLVPAAVRQSDLLTVMSRFSLRSPVGRGLTELPLARAVWPRRIGIVTRKGAYLSPLANRFIELLRERTRSVV